MGGLNAAQTAAATSSAALDRAHELFADQATVSREVLEGAQRQAAADTAALQMARSRVLATFGSGAPWLDARPGGAAILQALRAGSAVVVRAGFPGSLQGAKPGTMTVRSLGDPAGRQWQASAIWPGPADSSVPGPTLYGYVAQADGLAWDERLVVAVATGRKRSGFLLPASAVVLAGGQAWYYAVAATGQFSREPVDLDRSLAAGYFLPAVAPGHEQAVIRGASLLLAHEVSGVETED
jgi:hypothetical protein